MCRIAQPIPESHPQKPPPAGRQGHLPHLPAVNAQHSRGQIWGRSGAAACPCRQYRYPAQTRARSKHEWGQPQRPENITMPTQPSTPTVTGMSPATAIMSGPSHTCALLTGGTVQYRGENDVGRLGIGSRVDSALPGTTLVCSGANLFMRGTNWRVHTTKSAPVASVENSFAICSVYKTASHPLNSSFPGYGWLAASVVASSETSRYCCASQDQFASQRRPHERTVRQVSKYLKLRWSADWESNEGAVARRYRDAGR